jgi:hypothetical protein
VLRPPQFRWHQIPLTTLSRHLRQIFRPAAFLACGLILSAEENSPVDELREKNQQLEQRVDAQQRQIDELREQLDRLQKSQEKKPAAETEPAGISAEAAPEERKVPVLEETGRQIRLSGEAGVAFFNSNAAGAFPNSEFRVDDAKIFIETEVWKNAFLFGEIDLSTREASDEYFHLGELYADFERVLESGRTTNLNVRAGRFNIPFGEEYQVRNVVDNPLVTHSVADIWGVDEGVQAYGQLGPVRYNLAVQNGGHKTLHDYDPDKAVVARISVNPVPPLHLSASAMRTGKLNTVNDVFSETWIANAFFRALGPATTTPTFHAELAELDANWKWKTGHLNSAAGWINFNDANPAGDDKRKMNYFSIEAVQQVNGGLYGAARYSGVHAPKGYPLVGLGNFVEYEYGAPTTELERLSLGVGYRFGPPLVWKFEYSWEFGHLADGTSRSGDTNMLSTELGMRF